MEATCSNCRRRPATEVVQDESGSHFRCSWCVPRAEAPPERSATPFLELAGTVAALLVLVGAFYLLNGTPWLAVTRSASAPGPVGTIFHGGLPRAIDRALEGVVPLVGSSAPEQSGASEPSNRSATYAAPSSLPHGGSGYAVIPSGPGAPGEAPSVVISDPKDGPGDGDPSDPDDPESPEPSPSQTPSPEPTDPSPSPTPTDPSPTPDPTPTDPSPTPDPTPTDPSPTPDPTPTDPSPTPDPSPTDPSPTPDPTPTDPPPSPINLPTPDLPTLPALP